MSTANHALTVEAGLQPNRICWLRSVPVTQEFGLLFWQPSDQALVMPRRLSRLPGFDAACQVSADGRLAGVVARNRWRAGAAIGDNGQYRPGLRAAAQRR